MSAAVAGTRRFMAGMLPALLALSLFAPSAVSAASTDPDLLATLEHSRGDIEYALELGTLHFFDEENAPFAVQVVDACAVNDHLWVFGVGLSGVSIPLSVMDLDTGKSQRIVLPAFEPGKPIGTILEPEALPLCGDEPIGGLPRLKGEAIFTAARGSDYTDSIELLSDGRDDAYRRIVRGGIPFEVITRGAPIAAIDTSGAYDEIMLLTESRTPGRIHGVVLSGKEGMLPKRAKLDRLLKDVTRGRVRRVFEAAALRHVPQLIIDDLKLRGVREVYHVSLDLETLGADAYLAEAGWIKEGAYPLELPQPVAQRFDVEIATEAGEPRALPLLGPLVGSDAEGRLWEYGDGDAFVEIIDGCELNGSFWMLAGAVTDEPLELIITDTDTDTGMTVSHSLWTEYSGVSRISDTSSLPSCP